MIKILSTQQASGSTSQWYSITGKAPLVTIPLAQQVESHQRLKQPAQSSKKLHKVVATPKKKKGITMRLINHHFFLI